jgi:hypothetical protein
MDGVAADILHRSSRKAIRTGPIDTAGMSVGSSRSKRSNAVFHSPLYMILLVVIVAFPVGLALIRAMVNDPAPI